MTTTWTDARIKSLHCRLEILRGELLEVEGSGRPSPVKLIMARCVRASIVDAERQIHDVSTGVTS